MPRSSSSSVQAELTAWCVRSTGVETTEPTLTRRAVLGAGVSVAGAAVAGAAVTGVATLTGCGSAKRAAQAASGPASGAAGTVLAKVADIPVGDAVSATLHGQPILISQPTAGIIVAFTATCTHQGCTVAPAGQTFHCPCHDSVFNATTGQVISGPAPTPLDKVPVTVSGGNVVSG